LGQETNRSHFAADRSHFATDRNAIAVSVRLVAFICLEDGIEGVVENGGDWPRH
jgi:hypothetical protein